MTRTLPRLLFLVVLASSTVSAAANHKVFHVSTSSSPIVIAVLADRYTNEAKFENDVKNFITYGLMAHPYYAAHANELQVETFYEPAGQASKYGFNVEAPSDNCLLSWEVGSTPATNTWLKIQDVVGSINPRHTIVIGDHPYAIGCTDGEWTYVTEDAAGTDMLPHEFGHGIGQLHDEWSLADRVNVPHPGMSADPDIARNCHHLNNGATPMPPWTFPFSASHPACDLHGKEIVHAYNHMTTYGSHSYCLMGATSNAEFCPVCRQYMDQEFGYLDNPERENPDPRHDEVGNADTQNPTPPPPQTGNPRTERPPGAAASQGGFRFIRAAFIQDPGGLDSPPITLLPPGATGPIVRLVVSFNPADGSMTARKAFPITARYAPNHRRFSDYAYEILNGSQVLGTGVIPASLFRARNYQGGGGHVTTDQQNVDVTIQMPGVTAAMLTSTSRSFSIRVYLLMPGVTDRVIDPSTLSKLKDKKLADPRGGLNAAQIRAAAAL